MFVVFVMCCQVEVSATGLSLVQRSPAECGVPTECQLETSTRRRPRPTGGLSILGGQNSMEQKLPSDADNQVAF